MDTRGSSERPTGAGAPPWMDGRGEPWLWIALFGLICLVRLDAALIANETVYLVPSIRIADPSALAHDPWHAGSQLHSVSVLFRVLAAPLWWLSDDPLVVAWLARLTSWVWVLAGFRALGRALALPAWATTLGLALYMLTSPGIAAGEWIIKTGEQKVWSYGAAAFALAAMIRGHTLASGAWIGLATAFHVLVGGWSAIALGVASLVDRRRLGGLPALVRAGALAALIAAPVLVIGFDYLWTSAPSPSDLSGATASRSTDALVIEQTAKHLDPSHFMGGRAVREILAIFIATLWLASHTAPENARRLLTTHLATLVIVYASGFVASGLGLLGWMMIYPFRVADSLLPVMFWLLAPTALLHGWRTRGALATRPRVALAGVLVVAIAYFFTELPRHGVKEISRTLESWSARGRAERAERIAIYLAIRDELPENAIIAAQPCEERLWIYTRRGVVAARNKIYANDQIHEWAARIESLQGGEPVGALTWERCRHFEATFAAHDVATFIEIRDRWGATHALIEGVRDDLAPHEVLRAGGRTVIRLDTLGTPNRS